MQGTELCENPGFQQSLIQHPLHVRGAQGHGYEHSRCYVFTPDGTFGLERPVLKPIQLKTT